MFTAKGADPQDKSLLLFSKAKGRAEKMLLNSELNSKYIFRPGFINPSKKGTTYMFSTAFFKPIYGLLPFIGIDASKLAKVMLQVGLKGYKKIVWENKEMRLLSV